MLLAKYHTKKLFTTETKTNGYHTLHYHHSNFTTILPSVSLFLPFSVTEIRFERDYVYAGSFYAFCIWIGFGVLAIRDLVAWLTRRNNVTAAVAATVVCMGVPTILAAQNWDDHDRSHRYMARDIGWNYLMSTLPNSIILNYGDNDTFPLWNNQEIYGVRPDVRIMNTSYLGGEWYIDEMKTKANDAPGVPFSLPKSKYTFTNDWVPVDNRFDRAVDILPVPSEY